MISRSDLATLLAWLDTIEQAHTRAVNAMSDFFSEESRQSRRAMLDCMENAALTYVERPGDVISTLYEKLNAEPEKPK